MPIDISSAPRFAIAQPQRTVIVRVLRDLLRRIAGVVDEDFLRHDHDVDRVAESLDVELPAGSQTSSGSSDARLQAESSRNMYSEQGFDALMRAVFLRGVPAVDGGVELHARDRRTASVASAIWRIRSRAL